VPEPLDDAGEDLARLRRGGRAPPLAHLVTPLAGGCDEPDCVVPLCRACHRAYDRGELDLLPYLEPGYRVELAHGLRHLSLLHRLRRVTGVRWVPLEARSGPDV
jgi:hypothetical protein